MAALAGAVVGADDRVSAMVCATVAVGAIPILLLLWASGARRTAVTCLVVGIASATASLAADARYRALHTRLRAHVGARVGAGPVLSRLALTEDAAPAMNGLATLRGEVRHVLANGKWTAADGGVVVRVLGAAGESRRSEWRRGRVLQAPITYARPFHVFDRGVPDFERQAALDGVTLLGSVKSGLLIDIVAPGSMVEEWTAAVRKAVRHRVTAFVAPHGETSAAIVTEIGRAHV